MEIKYILKRLIVSILIILFFYLARLSIIGRQINKTINTTLVGATIDTSKYPEYRNRYFFEAGQYKDNIVYKPIIATVNNQKVPLCLEQEDYAKFSQINLNNSLREVQLEVTTIELNSGLQKKCITGIVKNNQKLINIKIITTSEKNPVYVHCSTL